MDTIWIHFMEDETPTAVEDAVQESLLQDIELVVVGTTVRVVTDRPASREVRPGTR